jgi:DNA-binding MarR family transcriptional regulator
MSMVANVCLTAYQSYINVWRASIVFARCVRTSLRPIARPKGRALITRGFGEHAAAMEDVTNVLSRNERLTLLRLLKKLGKHAAETRN